MADQNNALEISCPCCKAKIIVDRNTGSILHHEEAKRTVQSMDEFLNREKNKSKRLDSLFDKAKENQKNKMAELEKKFKYARDHESDLPDPKKLWD